MSTRKARQPGGGGHRRQPSQQSQRHDNSDFGDGDGDGGGDGGGGGGGGALAAVSDGLQQQQQLGHAPLESLDDMNLRVLRRYEPTIRAIEAVAASSVVYAFSSAAGAWVKSEPQIEGTLFLCEQEPLVVEHYVLPRACVFVLNRKGLTNVVVDLARVRAAEALERLLTLSLDDAGGGDTADGAPDAVLGLWIHGSGSAGLDGAQFDPDVVVRRWRAVRAALEANLGSAQLAETAGFLDAAAMMAKMDRVAQGRNPDGQATTAIGPQPDVRGVVAMVLGQAR